DAMTRKMELAVDALGLKPGDHVLEVGGGWGAFVEYAAQRGIEVTTLTLSKESERFLTELIERQDLPARVVREHVLRDAAPRRDAARDDVVRRWGGPLSRRFRLFLWGSAAGFDTGLVQAYRWVLRMPEPA